MDKETEPYQVCIFGMVECFAEEDIREIRRELNNAGIELNSIEQPSYPINGIEVFFPEIRVFLSDPIVQNIACGVAGSAIFTAIAAISKQLWKVICRRELTKIHPHHIIEENCAPNIHLIAGKLHAILPSEISEEEYNKFVEGFIAAINKETIAKENYYYYDPKTKQTAIFSKGKLLEIVSGGKYLNTEE